MINRRINNSQVNQLAGYRVGISVKISEAEAMACEKFASGSAIFSSAIDHMQTIAPNDKQCCQGTTWLDIIDICAYLFKN